MQMNIGLVGQVSQGSLLALLYALSENEHTGRWDVIVTYAFNRFNRTALSETARGSPRRCCRCLLSPTKVEVDLPFLVAFVIPAMAVNYLSSDQGVHLTNCSMPPEQSSEQLDFILLLWISNCTTIQHVPGASSALQR